MRAAVVVQKFVLASAIGGIPLGHSSTDSAAAAIACGFCCASDSRIYFAILKVLRVMVILEAVPLDLHIFVIFQHLLKLFPIRDRWQWVRGRGRVLVGIQTL